MGGMLSDITGIGSVFGALTAGTSGCGSRPICIGGGAGCEEKTEQYNKCLQKSIDSKDSQSKDKKIIIIVGIIALVIIASLFFKSRRRSLN